MHVRVAYQVCVTYQAGRTVNALIRHLPFSALLVLKGPVQFVAHGGPLKRERRKKLNGTLTSAAKLIYSHTLIGL